MGPGNQSFLREIVRIFEVDQKPKWNLRPTLGRIHNSQSVLSNRWYQSTIWGIVEQWVCPQDSSHHTASTDPRSLLLQVQFPHFSRRKSRPVRSSDLFKSHTYLISSQRTRIWVFDHQYCVCPPRLLQNRSPGCWGLGSSSSLSPFLGCAPSSKTSLQISSLNTYFSYPSPPVNTSSPSQIRESHREATSLLLILCTFTL